MPIWTQNELFEIVMENRQAIKAAAGSAPPEQLEKALQQTEVMESWLDAPFRDQLDEIFGVTSDETTN